MTVSRIALATLATRFPNMQLAVDPGELEWSGNAILRKLETLPIKLNPEWRRRT